MLDVDGRRLPGIVVEPAEPLGEHWAVRLDRSAVALLQPVTRVMALQERGLRVGTGVEDERWHLLEAGRRVELLTEPGADGRRPVEPQMLHGPRRIEARGDHRRRRRAEEQLAP